MLFNKQTKGRFNKAKKFLYFIGVFIMAFYITSNVAYAQMGSQVGGASSKASFSHDYDKLVHSSSTSSAAGTFHAAPIFIGEQTVPPYSTTTCDANKAGMLSSDGASLKYCNGGEWQTFTASGGGGALVGEVKIWTTGTAPSGYFECNGNAISRTTYAALFAILGTTYGTGDGSTTFNLPDYRGEFLRAWDNGIGNDADAASRTDRGDGTTGDVIGAKQSAANLTHLHSVDPPSVTITYTGTHRHTYRRYTYDNRLASGSHYVVNSYTTVNTGYSGNHTHTYNVATFTSGSTGGTEFRPRNVNVMYIIKY